MRLRVVLAIVMVSLAAPLAAQTPEGWMVRVDRSQNAEDPDEIARRLNDILEDVPKRDYMARNGRQRVHDEFLVFTQLCHWLRLLADCASTPQRERESWIRQLELTDIQRYEREMLDWMRTNKSEILETIKKTGKFESETEQKLIAALDEFAKIFQPTIAAGAQGTEAA